MTEKTFINTSLAEGEYLCDDLDVSDYEKVHVDVSSNGSVTIFGYNEEDNDDE